MSNATAIVPHTRRSISRMYALPIAIAWASLIMLAATALRAADGVQPEQVRARDLLKKVTVVGELGKPLGTLTTIRGVWRHVHSKDAEFVFRVSHIDGKPTKGIVEFPDHAIRPIYSAGHPTTAGRVSWDWKAKNDGKAAPPKTTQVEDGEEWEMSGAERGDLIADFSERFRDELGIAMASRPAGFESDFTFIAMRRISPKK